LAAVAVVQQVREDLRVLAVEPVDIGLPLICIFHK
jgi:hypothetical protein